MVFTATCRGCYLLSLLMQELKISSAALHSHLTQNRRLAALEKCAALASMSPVLLSSTKPSYGMSYPVHVVPWGWVTMTGNGSSGRYPHECASCEATTVRELMQWDWEVNPGRFSRCSYVSSQPVEDCSASVRCSVPPAGSSLERYQS